MTATNYSADDTALLIVDPYNDFMSEGGKLYERTKETADAGGFYDNMRKLIPAVRAAHIQIIIVPHHRWREGAYKRWKHMNPSQIRSNEEQAFAAGTWGGEFHPEFGPREGDVIVLEHWAQSGFANTDLDSQLKHRGIQKIILVGMIANTCVEATSRLGMELGYYVTLIKDATAAFSHEGMHAAHEVNGPAFAHAILTTKELMGLLPVEQR
ncbi:MAG TPA: isochorismatase family cysteine hydrolase [Nitrososphaeraceae archaeon]